jgi:hypothetical protein
MRVAVLPLLLTGTLFAACVPESADPTSTGGAGGSSSTGGRGGKGGSAGGSGGSATAGTGGASAGSGGSGTSTGGSGGSGGSTAGTGGASGGSGGGGGSSATGGSGGGTSDASAPADTNSTPEPTPPGAFPGCPRCKSIFDGKTLTGWQQSPAGSFEVKEGVIASTGKGAHAWTMEDYGEFRIIFSVRQIKGNHKPCTTLFTTRPGGNPARGLAGIQFQPPLGGSWDYRPGKNSGPDKVHWIYPNPRPTFDVLKWHRCEILARASTGEFRGACCEIEGKDSCKGIEVLHYKDATAGKKGPFALMMHNPGLFDEFKDFWVEVDPVGDELITMK